MVFIINLIAVLWLHNYGAIDFPKPKGALTCPSAQPFLHPHRQRINSARWSDSSCHTASKWLTNSLTRSLTSGLALFSLHVIIWNPHTYALQQWIHKDAKKSPNNHSISFLLSSQKTFPKRPMAKCAPLRLHLEHVWQMFEWVK